MKKLILLFILLIVGCGDYAPTEHTHELNHDCEVCIIDCLVMIKKDCLSPPNPPHHMYSRITNNDNECRAYLFEKMLEMCDDTSQTSSSYTHPLTIVNYQNYNSIEITYQEGEGELHIIQYTMNDSDYYIYPLYETSF